MCSALYLRLLLQKWLNWTAWHLTFFTTKKAIQTFSSINCTNYRWSTPALPEAICEHLQKGTAPFKYNNTKTEEPKKYELRRGTPRLKCTALPHKSKQTKKTLKCTRSTQCNSTAVASPEYCTTMNCTVRGRWCSLLGAMDCTVAPLFLQKKLRGKLTLTNSKLHGGNCNKLNLLTSCQLKSTWLFSQQ